MQQSNSNCYNKQRSLYLPQNPINSETKPFGRNPYHSVNSRMYGSITLNSNDTDREQTFVLYTRHYNR